MATTLAGKDLAWSQMEKHGWSKGKEDEGDRQCCGTVTIFTVRFRLLKIYDSGFGSDF
jgi:hypothetical protein